MNVQTAIGYLRSHGHEAFVTPDGLVSKRWRATLDGSFTDGWYEEFEVFPISRIDNGYVVSEAVNLQAMRDWLGY